MKRVTESELAGRNSNLRLTDFLLVSQDLTAIGAKKMKRLLILWLASFSTLLAVQVANARIETPRQGSVQSGIGVVRGWYCEAIEVAVSFDGKGLIEVPYGSTRRDTVNACGDDDNGFVLLWNYNTLGPGNHTVDLYVDGELVRTSDFEVKTLGAEFLSGKESGRRIYGFPDIDQDVVVSWQESRQGFVISDVAESINSFDISGTWAAVVPNGDPDVFLSVHAAPTLVGAEGGIPQFSEVIGTFLLPSSGVGLLVAGAMQRNTLALRTNADLGATLELDFGIVFTSRRSGILTILDCSPVSACGTIPVGAAQAVVKIFPSEEDEVLPSGITEDNQEEGSVSKLKNSLQSLSSESLNLLIDEMDGVPLKEISTDAFSDYSD